MRNIFNLTGILISGMQTENGPRSCSGMARRWVRETTRPSLEICGWFRTERCAPTRVSGQSFRHMACPPESRFGVKAGSPTDQMTGRAVDMSVRPESTKMATSADTPPSVGHGVRLWGHETSDVWRKKLNYAVARGKIGAVGRRRSAQGRNTRRPGCSRLVATYRSASDHPGS